jgi:hypothetical protein
MKEVETENGQNKGERRKPFRIINLTIIEWLLFFIAGVIFLFGVFLFIIEELKDSFYLLAIIQVAILAILSIKNEVLETKIRKATYNTILEELSKGEELTCRKIEKLLNQASGNKDPLLLKWGVKKMVRRLENYGYVERNSKIVPGYKITDKGLNLIRIYKF